MLCVMRTATALFSLTALWITASNDKPIERMRVLCRSDETLARESCITISPNVSSVIGLCK